MKAAELTDVLRRHYMPDPMKQPAGLFATEIGSPDGRRRADALWMPLVSSAGEQLVGHEIKVSRTDVLVELRDPSKCDPWLQFCGQWWLVVADPALVDGLEIPAPWGIMAPPSGRRTKSMTILRPAPHLKPRDPAPAIQRLLAWSYFRDRTRIAELDRRHEHDERMVEEYRRTIAELRAEDDAEASPLALRAMELLTKVDRVSAKRKVWGGPDRDELIAQAVADRLVVEKGTAALARSLDNVLRQISDPLGYAKDHITAARKLITYQEDL